MRKVDFSATFEGFIPILGGQEGKAEVNLGLEVTGLPGAEPGKSLVRTKIVRAELKFNRGLIPLSLDSIAGFFPDAPVEISERGVCRLQGEAKPAPPFRLPGLDVNRLAELVFVPIEFPAKETPQWTFWRMMGGAQQETLAQPEGERILLEQSQESKYLENEALEVVTDTKDAVASVTTKAVGKGWVKFDPKAGFVTASEVTTTSVSMVKPLDGSKTTERKLKSVMKSSWRS